MGNFLVIDFDYFFPNPADGGSPADLQEWGLYDWAHAETQFHINTIWSSRALAFMMAGVDLPQAIEPDGGWETWWDRFTFESDIPLLICDSNGWAGLERDPEDGSAFDSVWLYDAHHDSGYTDSSWPPLSGTFACEDWMLQHAEAGTQDLHVRYPLWRINAFGEPEPPVSIDRAFDDGSSPPITFHTVLACRSGAWVPPWCDEQFAEFTSAFPGPVEQLDQGDLVRSFHTAEIRTQAEWVRERIPLLREHNLPDS